jgi:hypothetical protein
MAKLDSRSPKNKKMFFLLVGEKRNKTRDQRPAENQHGRPVSLNK